MWRLDKKAVQWQVESPTIWVYAFAFNPSGDLLALGADDGLHLWSVATGNELMSFPGEEVFAVGFSQDGSLLAWGGWPGTVHLAELSRK
jgi:WD40 repeat protein